MADQKLTALTEDTSPSIDDYIYSVNDPAGTPASRRSTIANFYKSVNGLTEDTAPSGINDFLLSYDTSATSAKKIRLIYLLALYAPEGQLINGVIAPSVTSNNLTVAIKTLAGGDPSASDPVMVKINNTIRTITAATSITLNAGTNWFNSGSASLATNQIDYFCYAIWDSNSSLVAIAPARIPYASIVSEFSATTTNEKHIGNYSNYTSTDDVTVIGRFAATLSAGAGYTWTVPTYTSINLKNYPVYETRLLNWSPVWTALTVGDGTVSATYRIVRNVVYVIVSITFGSTTSISGSVSITPPFVSLSTNTSVLSDVVLQDTGSTAYVGTLRYIDATTYRFFVKNVSGTYEALTALSSTVPHTWATTDVIVTEYQYGI